MDAVDAAVIAATFWGSGLWAPEMDVTSCVRDTCRSRVTVQGHGTPRRGEASHGAQKRHASPRTRRTDR
jgi:hypothetical protein